MVRREGTGPGPSDAPPSRESALVEGLFGGAEAGIYFVAAGLLICAGAFIGIGTVADLIEGIDERSVTASGVLVLSRVLLLFIIAELLYTLRLVNFGGRILVEPFLFIGLIAVVRRILVLTAEIEGKPGRDQITDFIIQLGALAGLALVLSIAIHLLRRSGSSDAVSP
jgi:uncharacterized membrane protein (DUF373 family)